MNTGRLNKKLALRCLRSFSSTFKRSFKCNTNLSVIQTEVEDFTTRAIILRLWYLKHLWLILKSFLITGFYHINLPSAGWFCLSSDAVEGPGSGLSGLGAGKSPSTSNSTSSSKLSLKFIINSGYLIHVWKVSSEMQREIRKKIQPMG